MKKIYLVRHGESEGNIGDLRQGSITPLSESGEAQAQMLTRRFENVNIDKIISSPQVRAKHTAETIDALLNIGIEFSELLIERKRPSSLVGKPKKDPNVLLVDNQIKEHFHDLEWHHSDEENFTDLKNRVIDLFEYIEGQQEESILLVTHGVLMRMIVAYVVMGEKLTSYEYWDFFVTLEVDNASISVLKQSKFEDEKPRWNIVTWNDVGHLE
jgi:broad specificity phosphatase PhoE